MDGKYLFLRRVADAPDGLPKSGMSTLERGYYRVLAADRLVAADFERVYIRPAGLAALASYQEGLREDARRRRVEDIRYAITTAIAAAALVVAIIALIVG